MSRLKTIAEYMGRGTVTLQEQCFAWQLNDEDKAEVGAVCPVCGWTRGWYTDEEESDDERRNSSGDPS